MMPEVSIKRANRLLIDFGLEMGVSKVARAYEAERPKSANPAERVAGASAHAGSPS